MAVRHLPIGEPNPDDVGASLAPTLTWRFWVKAGMGFTFGAGIAYGCMMVVWTFAIMRVPGLYFMRMLLR